MGMILVGAIAAPAFFPLAANGGTGGAFAYSVIMGVLLVRGSFLACMCVVGGLGVMMMSVCVSVSASVYITTNSPHTHPNTPTENTKHKNHHQHAHNDKHKHGSIIQNPHTPPKKSTEHPPQTWLLNRHPNKSHQKKHPHNTHPPKKHRASSSRGTGRPGASRRCTRRPPA